MIKDIVNGSVLRVKIDRFWKHIPLTIEFYGGS